MIRLKLLSTFRVVINSSRMMPWILYHLKKVEESFEIYGTSGNIYYAIRYVLAFISKVMEQGLIFLTSTISLYASVSIENDIIFLSKHETYNLENSRCSLAREI